MLTADQLAAMRKYPTPTVANALERLGAAFNCTDGRVRCLFPELGVSLGYAVTATVRSANPPAPDWVKRLKPYWDHVAAAPGPKLLVAHELDRPCGGAFYGEVNSTIHQTLGCVGLITDGAVRDLEETRRIGFQFLAAEVTVSHGHAHLAGWGEPVEVFGLRVAPGDLIHADRHGAVVIPADVADRVADACRAIDDSERPMLELCRSPGFNTAEMARLIGGIV